MKNKYVNKMKVCIIIALVYSCLGAGYTKAGCSYGPIMVTCHNDPGYTNSICCGWTLYAVCWSGKDQQYEHGTAGLDIKNPSLGLGPSCGGGSSATGIGSAFTGTCGWNESGSTCGTPWGPTPETGDYTAYPCTGTCG